MSRMIIAPSIEEFNALFALSTRSLDLYGLSTYIAYNFFSLFIVFISVLLINWSAEILGRKHYLLPNLLIVSSLALLFSIACSSITDIGMLLQS